MIEQIASIILILLIIYLLISLKSDREMSGDYHYKPTKSPKNPTRPEKRKSNEQ